MKRHPSYCKLWLLVAFLVTALVVGCRSGYQVSKTTQENIAINLKKRAPSIEEMIEPYRSKLSKSMEHIIGYTPEHLTKKNGLLQNVFSDILYEKSHQLFPQTDFALINTGGLRNNVNKGDIYVKTIYEVMPFDNKIVVVKLSGTSILKLIKYLKERHQPIANAYFRDGVFFINHQAFDSSKSYYVATSDYLQRGGDQMTFFKTTEKQIDLKLLMRDAFLSYFENHKRLTPSHENRYQ